MEPKTSKQIVFVPRLPDLNQYIKAMNANRHIGNEMKRNNTDMLAMIFKSKLYPVKYPVIIMFTYIEPNAKKDPDNIVAAKKFILDGLVVGGILPNDTQKWVRGFEDRWLVRPDGPSGVMIAISELSNVTVDE